MIEYSQCNYRERSEEDIVQRKEPVIEYRLAGKRCVDLEEKESETKNNVLVEEIAYLSQRQHGQFNIFKLFFSVSSKSKFDFRAQNNVEIEMLRNINRSYVTMEEILL